MAVLTENVPIRGELLRGVDKIAQRVERTREELIDDAIDKYLQEAQRAESEKVQVDRKREEAFERLMNYPRVKVPDDFDYKKELAEARDERFNR